MLVVVALHFTADKDMETYITVPLGKTLPRFLMISLCLFLTLSYSTAAFYKKMKFLFCPMTSWGVNSQKVPS